MKKINTQGITDISPIEGGTEWYWGTDVTGGDLYEAEELFRSEGQSIRRNRLVLIHYPDGRVVEPVAAKDGQYFGIPVREGHKIDILLADFSEGELQILQFDDTAETVSLLAAILFPLAQAQDCYNLMLKLSPLMLTRQDDSKLQILWPEYMEYEMGAEEAFLFREGERLYFSAWYEDPDYREEILVRKADTGEMIERISGNAMRMPDGQVWVLS